MVFICPVCLKSFLRDQGLLDHLMKDHKNSFLNQSDQPKLLSEQINDQPKLLSEQANDQPNLTDDQSSDQTNPTNVHHNLINDQAKLINDHYKLINDHHNRINDQANLTSINDHNSLIDKQGNEPTEVLSVKSEPMDESSVEPPFALKIESVKSEVETNVKCQLCPKQFAQRAHLNNHLMIEHLNRKFDCPDCGEDNFRSFNSLGLHIRRIHGKMATFKCHICIIHTKEYTSSSTLVRHYLSKHLNLEENAWPQRRQSRIETNQSGLLGRSGKLGPCRQIGQLRQAAPSRPIEPFRPNRQIRPIAQVEPDKQFGQFGSYGQFEQNAIGMVGQTSLHQLQNASFQFQMARFQTPVVHPKPPIPPLPASISLLPASSLPVQEPTQPQNYPFIPSPAPSVTASLDPIRVPVQPVSTPLDGQATIDAKVPEEKTVIAEGVNNLPENQYYNSIKENSEPELNIEHSECTEKENGFPGSSCNQCKLCGQEYTGSLTQHLLVVHLVRTFDCDYCGIESSNFIRLAKHIKAMHPNQPIIYRCHICDNTKKSFVNSSSLVTHLLKSHLNLKHGLKSLKETKVASKERSKEIKAVHPNRYQKLQCELCGIEVHSIRQRTHHYLTQHLNMKFTCQICGFDGKDFHALAMHKMKHHPGQPKNLYNCDFCPHTYNNSSALKVHLFSVHLKLKLHKCELCGKEYGTNMTLRQHIQTAHVGNFDCKLCGEQIKTRTKLSVHIEKEHELSCHKCFKQYGNRSKLYHHLRADCSSKQPTSMETKWAHLYPSISDE